jgi:hypothetical protein
MLLDDDDAMEFIRQKMAEAEPSQRLLPVWGYILLFVGPGTLSFVALYVYMGLNLTFSGVIALAIMNGSINSMIAWLTIRLDGHSTDALDHLELIMSEMEKFDQTLNSANEKIESFTTDLDKVSELFHKVGLDLADLDLEPVAEVVQKLKENKDGLGEVLDNLREIDVSDYIDQAKRIQWKELLNSVEDIMGFIQKGNSKSGMMKQTVSMPKLPKFPTPQPIAEPTISDILEGIGAEDDGWGDDDDFFTPAKTKLTLKRPKPPLTLKRPRNS